MSVATRRAWPWVFAASLAAIGAADAVVLDLARGYFGSGYNGVALRAAGELGAFFLIGAVLDAAGVATVWCSVVLAARAIGARGVRVLAGAALLGIALPLAFDLVLHRLHRVLGDVLELGLLLDLAAGDWRNALGQAAQDLPPLALLAVVGVAGAAAGFALLTRIERAMPERIGAALPRARSLALAAGACAALGVGAIAGGARWAPALEFGWSEKPAGRALRALAGVATDLDRDGYGWLSRPSDPAPLDATIHPFAIEIPGNGIDENGVGGDLPVGVAVPRAVSTPQARPRPGSPSVVLIFLESFRADLVGLRVGGREVTPSLNALAASGTHATAYAHVPVTWASRASLLQGRVIPTADGQTLVDDFIARGYEVAWFSGQHDGLAAEDARLGTDRADVFRDARDDVERRTSRSAQPISLQVSWKTVLGRVREHLRTRSHRKPLFLYVNLVDTHYPYWHGELDDLLGFGELPRDAIRPEQRDRVWRAYLNAAANVDGAIGQLLTAARERLGAGTLVVVTGDHGQSFYENGLLGHGQALDDAQSAVPFVASGIAAALPSPLALSDVRGILGRALDGSVPTPEELERSEIFQHLGAIERPAAVALRGRARIRIVDLLATRRAPPAVSDVIHVWETLDRAAWNAKRRRP